MKGCTTVFILNTWKHMESIPRVLDLSLAPRMLSSYGIYWPNFSKLVSEVTSLTHVQGKVCSFFHDLMRLGKYLVHFVQTHIGGNTFSCFATLLCCQGRHSAGCCTVGAWSSVPGMLKLTPQSLIQFDSVWIISCFDWPGTWASARGWRSPASANAVWEGRVCTYA